MLEPGDARTRGRCRLFLRGVSKQLPSRYPTDWIDSAQGRPVEGGFFMFELVQPALGPSKEFPAAWTVDNAVPLVIVDEFIHLAVKGSG